MRQYNIIGKQWVRDALAIIAMIVFYNLYNSIAYDTLQHINVRKVVWAFIGGFFVFVPMYAILWLTLRKLRSNLLFFLISLGVWLAEPIIMSQWASKTFNAWQGSYQIFKDGELTLYGYFYWLQNPFFFLVIYAAFFFGKHLHKKLQNNNEDFKQ